MNRGLYALAAALLSGVAGTGAFADDSETTLRPIVIFGKTDRLCIPRSGQREAGDRRPMCAGEGLSRDYVAGDTFDREQLDRLPAGSQAQDLVKRLPGVVTGGGPGEDKEARVFGLDKEYTRTSIDGIVLPDGGEKREFNLDNLPSALVDSVEVVRGRRADMEADGLAGRIDVKLADIPETPRYEGNAAIGHSSDGVRLFDFDLLGGGMYGPDFGAQLGLSRARNSNSKLKTTVSPKGVLSASENEEKQVDTFGVLGDVLWQNDANAFHFKPLILGNDESKVKTSAKYKADGSLNSRDVENEHKDKRTYGFSATWRHDFDGLEGASLELRGGHYRTSEDKAKTKRSLNAAGVENAKRFETEVEDKFDRITFGQFDFVLPVELNGIHHDVKTGAMIRVRDRAKQRQRTVGGVVQAPAGKDVYGIDETVWAAYVLDDIDFNNGVSMAPGLRVETADLTAALTDGGDRGARIVDLLPSLPVHVALSDAWSLDAGVARLVNRPKFDMLIPQNSSTLLGNPEMAPERAWAFDGGVTYQTGDVELSFGLFSGGSRI